ncbi:hypothetical protein E4198_18730 [Streptomyces sp. RKND-216]|uniref:hypothetical protein n=1 Tax=Streptomyces sp. RKND-216 TaxID=2562581 RepID=UPI00109DC333|nr:hypothetical protein [Streptomyces sp. RKND-216]THA26447.1 hypothetical protein E4198_18730 [Streptomyces sp. RKND-216]
MIQITEGPLGHVFNCAYRQLRAIRNEFDFAVSLDQDTQGDDLSPIGWGILLMAYAQVKGCPTFNDEATPGDRGFMSLRSGK